MVCGVMTELSISPRSKRKHTSFLWNETHATCKLDAVMSFAPGFCLNKPACWAAGSSEPRRSNLAAGGLLLHSTKVMGLIPSYNRPFFCWARMLSVSVWVSTGCSDFSRHQKVYRLGWSTGAQDWCSVWPWISIVLNFIAKNRRE